MAKSIAKPVVHGTKVGRFEVTVDPNPAFLFLPSTQNPQMAFVCFGCEWKYYSGRNGPSHVLIEVPLPQKGVDEVHYDVVFLNNTEPPLGEDIALRERVSSKIYIQKQLIEPNEWHPEVIVERSSGNFTKFGIGDKLLAEWLGDNYIMLYGNVNVIASNGLQGYEAIKALHQTLGLVLERMDQLGIR